jgi:hypothetical protein
MHRSAQFGNRASDLAWASWEQPLVFSVYNDQPKYQNLLSTIQDRPDFWYTIDSFLGLLLYAFWRDGSQDSRCTLVGQVLKVAMRWKQVTIQAGENWKFSQTWSKYSIN